MVKSESRRSFAFVFVCQPGDLELKAVLLAASLRHNLRCDYELIAAVPLPAERWGELQHVTKDALRQLNVRIAPITNTVDSSYPISNKVACLSLPTTADKLVFLDSDILCTHPFNDGQRFVTPFAAKPADLQTFSSEVGPWEAAYRAVGAPMPAMRLPSTSSREFGLPYFNSGVIFTDPGIGLGEAWERCCQLILADPSIPGKSIHADQISLAIAVQQLGLPYDALDERYNYPAHLIPLAGGAAMPYFCHYHQPQVIRREPAVRLFVQQLIARYPSIGEVAESDPQWSYLVRPVEQQRHTRSRQSLSSFSTAVIKRLAPGRISTPTPSDIIISGIPRSGTSFLCNLLHRYSNCVVLNEPREVYDPLMTEAVPWQIATFYSDIRADVLEGKPIRNKLKDGKVTEDTVDSESVEEYVPRVDNASFVLGTKTPLAYLLRIDAIRAVMPHARVVLCVRNPFDTIASWKGSFPHLREATISQTPMRDLDAPWVTARQRTTLSNMVACPSAAVRRAWWWQFLAELVIAHASDAIVVDYARLTTQPQAVAEEILRGFRKGHLREPVQPSQVRQGRSKLDVEDEQAIRAICSQAAADLGLEAPAWALAATLTELTVSPASGEVKSLSTPMGDGV